jgi:prophage regulatory protein
MPKHVLIKRDVVIARTGLTTPTIYRLMKAGTFPPPIQLLPANDNRNAPVAWIESQVQDWIDERVAKATIRVAKKPKRGADGLPVWDRKAVR